MQHNENFVSPLGLRPIRWAHFTEGGTGVTNLSFDVERRASIYMQAALNLGMNGITVVNRSMYATKEEGYWSLHDCADRQNLSDFWDEVRRLETLPEFNMKPLSGLFFS